MTTLELDNPEERELVSFVSLRAVDFAGSEVPNHELLSITVESSGSIEVDVGKSTGEEVLDVVV